MKKTKSLTSLITGVTILFLFAFLEQASADVFRWKDEEERTHFTDDVNKIPEQFQPEALLGLYHCPWDDQDFEGARRRVLGLDFDLLKETVDVFSPMVYHARMGKKADWVHEHVNWLSNRLDIGKEPNPKIWPIVQAHDGPEIISSVDFETVLRHGLSGKSSGVMMFTSNTIAENHDKRAVMKKVYTTMY